jgi:membrane-associated phospholipid phosphatase
VVHFKDGFGSARIVPKVGDGPLRVAGRFRANIAAIRSRSAQPGARANRVLPRLLPSTKLALLALCVVLIVLVGIAFDADSVLAARRGPSWSREAFGWVSWAGEAPWELVPAALLVILLLGARWEATSIRIAAAWSEIGAIAAYGLGSIGGAGILVNILKQPIGRGRPPTFDRYGAFVLQPFRFTYDFQSFPSGHSTTAGCLIAIGWIALPRLRVPLLLFGLSIGLSRVMVGAHYPSDVLAGWMLGFGFSVWLAGRFADFGWGFRRDSAGRLRPRLAAVTRSVSGAGGWKHLLGGLSDALRRHA